MKEKFCAKKITFGIYGLISIPKNYSDFFFAIRMCIQG